jgi:AraC family transcriptional regulator, regulatory protein of adaptative response / methylated-DNA-[protein]-cysteine methyltransferase
MSTAVQVKTPLGMDEVRKACAFIQQHADAPITLARIAQHVNASPFHFQRVFTRLVGISPRAYQDALRAGRFRRGLRDGAAVTGAIYDAGYGSSSRVYERLPTGRGMTPAVYKSGARGVEVTYAIADSPLGRLLVAATAKGICSVKLGDKDETLERELRHEYPAASIAPNRSDLARWVHAILTYLSGRRPHLDLPLDIQATAFQWKVWRYLQAIPYGETRAYSQVARDIGRPAAVRAVARACATNPVCLVIPCHRVVGKDGSLTGYRWGVERKRTLLKNEK